MWFVVETEVFEGWDLLGDEEGRQVLLDRILRLAGRRGVTVLAWRLVGPHLRAVFEGEEEAVRRTLTNVKSGTSRAARALDRLVVWRGCAVRPLPDREALLEAVVSCHRSERGDPLQERWTSHRDLMGLRQAVDFDAAPLRARVEAAEVHARLGGAPLPEPTAPPEGADLATLLDLAAEVRGANPADRRCFRLFVHLARAAGHGSKAAARALLLTPRRIRQLAAADEPALPAAQRLLGLYTAEEPLRIAA